MKSKGGGKNSIHYNASPETTELQLETIVAVNQFSIQEAVTKWCNSQDLPETVESPEEDNSRDVPPELVTMLTKHETPD